LPRRHLQCLVVLAYLLVSACGGDGSENNNSDNFDEQPLAAVTGRVTFDLVPFNNSFNGLDYNNIAVSPARGIRVQTVDLDGNIIDSTSTDNNGEFRFKLQPKTDLRLRISAQMHHNSGPKWDIKVTDNTNSNALYITEGEVFTSSLDGSVRNFHLASGWDGTAYSQPRAAGPFAILDAIYESIQKLVAVDPDINLPPLEIRWSVNNSVAEGDLEDGDIGTSFYSDSTIYLVGKADSDTDEYDRHIVIHEWGHYFEDMLSRSDSIGGLHGIYDRLDLRVAFSEGWGNALSAIITDNPIYRDSFGAGQAGGWWLDIEDNRTTNAGWFNESSVHSILYDLYDNHGQYEVEVEGQPESQIDTQTDGQDTTALGLGPIYETLVSNNYKNTNHFTSIYSFIDELKRQQPQSVNVIDKLLNEQFIYGTGSDGTNEINNGDIPSVLPVYKTAVVDGNPVTLCSVDNAGSENKLGNSGFAVFAVSTPGAYRIDVNRVFGAVQSDPDFLIYKQGAIIHIAEGVQNGQETASINFTDTGTYLINVFDKNNIKGNGRDVCFNLQLSAD